MVNRQHGTESSPWVGKDSTGQPLTSPAAGWKPFPQPEQPTAGSFSLPKVRASCSLILALARLKDGWEKGCKKRKKLLPLVGQRALCAFGVGTDSATPKERSKRPCWVLASCLSPHRGRRAQN